MPNTRVRKKYCRLKHMEVIIIEEARPGIGGAGDTEWHFKRCLRADEECYRNGCLRQPTVGWGRGF